MAATEVKNSMETQLVFSKYFGKEIEVASETIVDGNRALTLISHDGLEDIISNNPLCISNNVQYHITKEIAEPGHYAFMCAMWDKNGKKVEAMGESYLKYLKTKIAQEYPTLTAFNRAFDAAAISFLGLPSKVYSDQQIDLSPTDNVTFQATPAKAEDDHKNKPVSNESEPTKEATASENIFESTRITFGQLKNLNYTVKEAYEKSPDQVRWIATNIETGRAETINQRDVCRALLEVANDEKWNEWKAAKPESYENWRLSYYGNK